MNTVFNYVWLLFMIVTELDVMTESAILVKFVHQGSLFLSIPT